MKYSIYIITAFLLSATSLFSLVELEEVLQIYPDGGSADYSKVYLNGDTILVNTELSTQNNNYDLILSTDRGNSWRDITEKIKPITRDFYHKYYSELGSYFVLHNYKDTTIDYYNLDGILQKKAKPNRTSLVNVEVILNPLNEYFVATFYNYTDIHHGIHYQEFKTSIDRGENWNNVSPTSKLEPNGNQNYSGSLTIDYKLSIGNKNRIFFKYSWGDLFNYFGTAYFIYDANSKEIELTPKFIDNNYCVECTGDYKVVYKKEGPDNYISSDIFTNQEEPYSFINNSIGWDADSIAQNKEKDERLIVSGRTTNLRSPNHQIIELTHYMNDINIEPKVYDFVHQYYFQTFDFGDSWELIYKNTDKNELVQSFKINPSDKVLWVIKGVQVSPDYHSDTKKPILYKSKEPLTSIKESTTNQDLKVSLSDSKLSIKSNDYKSSSSIRIFNLEGKELQSINLSLNKGLNEIIINKTNEKLLFISIEMEGNSNQIYKLLNNN